MSSKDISIIVPCYNEENNVELFYNKTIEIFKNNLSNIEIIFVNDGSNDDTLENLKNIYKKTKCCIKIINFSRNFGKEAAVLAGLERSFGKYTVIIDADLQQNPKYIIEMKNELDSHKEYDVVCCVQQKRKESKIVCFLKGSFYKIMNKMMEVEFVSGASDFRMMRRDVVQAIISLPENCRFSKGIFSWVGFNTYYMPYEVENRASGKSKWSIKKLFQYAFNGIVSFSNSPLLLSLKIGLFNILISIIMFIIIFIMLMIGNINNFIDIFIIDLIIFFSGITLVSNGIIGKYLANNYAESKNRPKYIIKEYINNEGKN